MRRPCIPLLLIVLAFPAPALAQAAVICFGNEPSWSVDLTSPDTARVTLPGEAPVVYRGKATALPFLEETLWRGQTSAGDLVVLMREEACSDGMSDITHPRSARVSLPDGRALAGCCRLPGAAAARQPSFEGAAWRLTALTGQGADALVAGSQPVTARFEGGRVTGFSGCNRFTGSYTTEEGRLIIGQLAGTMMACAPAAMAIEKAFKQAFSGTLRYAVTDGTLNLTADSGTTLSFVEDAGRLDGVTWNVTGYNNGRQAVVSPVKGSRLTLTFADGAVSGSSGCNTFRSGYGVDGAQITVQPAIVTRKACAAELMEQEQQFLAALQSSMTFSIEGRALDMHRKDGERTIHATTAR